MNETATILTITGSDGSGESGVQADIKAIAQLGGYAVSAITSITVQNTLGIQEFYDLPASVVRQQVEALINDVQPQVVKIGLLRRIDVAEALAGVLRRYRPRHIIYDPTVRSARGDELVSAEVEEAVGRLLQPLCTLVLDRAEQSFHGRGNQFSSAVAVYLSKGAAVEEAVRRAQDYLRQSSVAHEALSGRSGELYGQFLEAVERFYRHYSDVAFYAEQLNVSSRYLAQVTRRIIGRSPKAIIDERLMAELQRELLATSRPLKELADSFGFSSQAHLAKFFKKQQGVSPTDFRKSGSQT